MLRNQLQGSAAPSIPGFASRIYGAYVLGILTAVYTFSCVDRALLGIIQEPVKIEFSLTDLQLGLLGGPAFALLYTLLGLPIARLAERSNRIAIIAVCACLWSVMTAISGLAASFAFLFAARIGVSIGEAGCSPPATSVIADYSPPELRARAMSVYSLAVPFGSIIAAVGGGWIAQHYGWRNTFLWLGAPGVALAAVLWLTTREPARTTPAEEAGNFRSTMAVLARKPSYWHVAFGSALAAFVGYGVKQYLTSFLIRSHSLTLLQGATVVAVALGICSAIGVYFSGHVIYRYSKRYPRILVWLPALGLALATPLFLLVFHLKAIGPAFTALLLASATHVFYMGPMFAVCQGVAPPRMRATALAVTLVLVNLIGYGLGPPVIGALSDMLANASLAAQGITRNLCSTTTAQTTCAAALGTGLRLSMMVASCVQLWAALHFILAMRSLKRDWSPNG